MLSRLYQRLSHLGGNVDKNRGIGRGANVANIQPIDASRSAQNVTGTTGENLVCCRCKDIDIVTLLETKKTRSSADLERIGDRSNNEAETVTVNLGPYRDLSFDQACPLCKLIIALLPEEQPRDAEKDIFLMPARSLYRLEPEV